MKGKPKQKAKGPSKMPEAKFKCGACGLPVRESTRRRYNTFVEEQNGVIADLNRYKVIMFALLKQANGRIAVPTPDPAQYVDMEMKFSVADGVLTIECDALHSKLIIM